MAHIWPNLDPEIGVATKNAHLCNTRQLSIKNISKNRYSSKKELTKSLFIKYDGWIKNKRLFNI